MAHRIQLILAIALMLWVVIFGMARCVKAETVTIITDGGGDLIAYIARANQYRKDGTKVAIIGSCASACTVFLGLPQGQVCVDRQAWIGFHQTSSVKPQPEAVRASYDDLLWQQYPDEIKRAVGRLTPNLTWLRGREIIPAIPQCR